MKTTSCSLRGIGGLHVGGLLVIGAVVFGLRAAALGEGPDDSKPSIADLAWIAGDWRAEEGDNVLQEVWEAPLGDSMFAMFRWIRADKLWMSEHITVVAGGDKITYRFRHFSRDLAAWEEKTDPITFELVSVREGEAVFENPSPPKGRPKRIIYRRDGSTLTVRLEGESNEKPDVFTFQRHEG